MDEATLLLAVLLVALIAIAVFSNAGNVSGPLSTPPNPNAEFGVVHEKPSFFGGFFGPSQNEPATEKPIPTPPTTLDMLRKNISISESGARERDAQKEYVRISYYSSSGQPVVLTG